MARYVMTIDLTKEQFKADPDGEVVDILRREISDIRRNGLGDRTLVSGDQAVGLVAVMHSKPKYTKAAKSAAGIRVVERSRLSQK